MWDYNSWLYEQLKRIAINRGFDNYEFHVFDEQDFLKNGQIYNKNDIFVIIKKLSSSIMYNTKVVPLQILILSEENVLQVANIIFKDFANSNNWHITIDGNKYIKHQYAEPVVMSNFQPLGTGYRSVLYVSGTLYEMDDVVDVYDVKIDDESIVPISFSTTYTLATDTQDMNDSFFAKSVRQTQTLGFSLTIPAKQTNFVKKMLTIMRGSTTGDSNFKLTFKIKGIEAEFIYFVKMSGLTLITAPTEIPNLQVGLML